MNHENKTILRINKLKTYLEVNFNNFNEIEVLEGIEVCEKWINELQKGDISEKAISDLKLCVNKLGNNNHALEEVKYEFNKWVLKPTSQ